MDLHSYSHGEHGRFEQILNQFLLKSLHIILDSRVPANRPSSRSGEVKKSDKWFNLALGDRPAAMDSLSFWNRSLMEPMIIDIILVQESTNSSSDHFSRTATSLDMFTEMVVERWTVQYEFQRSMAPQIGDASYKKTYKKSIIMLRSVYSMLRLFPAYKAYRKLCSLNRECNFEINYKVCSFGAPFSREEEESMSKYSFIPVDAQQGRLSISVMYRKHLSDFNLDAVVSCPPSIISDYVGSPLTDPMREFPSEKGGARATFFPIRGKQSNNISPFQRPHSWTSGLQRNNSLPNNQMITGSPPLHHSPYEYSSSPTEVVYRQRNASLPNNQMISGSPPLHRSPYEYSSSPTDVYTQRNQYQRSPAHQRTISDELLSPPFSSSPSPSPPVHSRLRSETAPMSIPHPMIGRSPRYLSPNLSDPNRNSLPPPSPRNAKYDPSSHESPSGIRLIRRPDLLRAGELSSGSISGDQKVSRDGKEDSGRFSSLLSSSSSPRIGFSRSSSRLSFQDDFGDSDFSCPFIVDDVDSPDIQASPTLDGRKEVSMHGKKSQDAAVGALVHMLRSAPPLRQDSSYQTSKLQQLHEEVGSVSEFLKPRKTSDALEELKVYKQMKDLLLSKSEASMSGKGKAKT